LRRCLTGLTFLITVSLRTRTDSRIKALAIELESLMLEPGMGSRGMSDQAAQVQRREGLACRKK